METNLFVLLFSVFVLLVAFYVEQRRIQIQDELLQPCQHENETEKMGKKFELSFTLWNPEKKDYLQGLPAIIFCEDIGNVSVKLGEKKDYLQQGCIVLCSAKYKEKKDYLQGLPAGIFRKDIGNVSVKLGETIIELIPKYEDLERTAAGSRHLGPTDEDLERTTAAGSPHLGPTDPVRIATASPCSDSTGMV
ncbi:uncharacterized protein LOC143047285 [Mytilus galloprovincialis]|uniref:uncharacterized protein LOC143047285 n=1 Tax=Mytilus galloprovincialis TaxID=29158 RepID=UPI003F7C309F